MAPAPEGKRGFSWSKPGAKEYLVVGGVVLAGALAYMWWKNRQAAGSGTAETPETGGSSSTTTTVSRTGLSTGDFLAWIRDHSTGTTAPEKPEKTKRGVVPNVVGREGDEARDDIERAGFRALQLPPVTPHGLPTVVTSQNPRGGRHAVEGSDVAIRVETRMRSS